ncbi:MAG TPA: undecaprenyl-diphosphate phosphatase [Candidatus Gastranaerophilales bacterium]|nr:undecaprenyl-diphosphate phosphatase [Candidatus Gastranaerophilales bacterium]
MDLTQALITGVIQGLTEFLPVSSSGHIVLTSSIYKLITGKPLSSGGSEEIFFDIMLHIGTLVAILIYFRQDIAKLLSVFISSLKDGTLKTNHEAKIPLYIVLGTMTTVLIAFPFKDYFESLVHNPAVVGIILMITGTLLFSTEFISQKLGKKDTFIGWKRSVIIGIAQGFAVAPGLSRSGATIAAGLASGLDRVTCARYSFLLSIPIILLAGIYHSLELLSTEGFTGFNWVAILAGTLVSGLVGYFCIKYFIIFISKNKLHVFAIYCWIVGALMAIFFNFA